MFGTYNPYERVNIMIEKVAKLINVKSIVTIILTGIFSFLSVRGDITGEQFLMIFTTIIAFYFGTQSEKKKNEGEECENKH